MMKKIFTLLLSWLIVGQIFAHSMSPTTETFLFNHLADVNQEWLKQTDLPKIVFDKRSTFKNDTERIQQHLKLVEQTLRQRSTSHLNLDQKAKRLHHLDVLKQYWEAAQFPTNAYHSHRQPYFVDDFGIHCAVGYLLHKDGQNDFVNTIRTKNNYAYIHELTKYPQLAKWAIANGFTVNELAWIQPGYSPPHQDYDALGNNGGADGDIFTMKVTPDSSMLILAGDFTTMDGVTANSIIGWNGSNWQTFADGVDGVIYDLTWRGGQLLVIVGNFKINNQQANIAYWDDVNSTWIPLQTGDMQGSIYTIYATWNDIYIGGDFQKVNGVSMPYLAKKKGGLAWDNSGGFSNNTPNVFAVDGPVKCIKRVAGQILIGGEFTQTAPLSNDPNQQISCNYLAYWDFYNWTYGLNGPNATVHTFMPHEGKLYVGGDLNDMFSVSVFELGLWTNYSYGFFPHGSNGFMEDFFVYNDQVFGIGDFSFTPVVGNYSRSIISFSSGGVSLADSSITAAAVFNDKVFLAGRFNSIDGQVLRQVASSYLGSLSSSNRLDLEEKAKVFYHQNQIVLEFEPDFPKATFQLLDASGRMVKTYAIRENEIRLEISTFDLAKGVYFYQIQTEIGQQSGKLGIF